MRTKVFLLLILFQGSQALSWGLTGHRVVGEIAQHHLSKKARKAIRQILGHESLADVANYLDFIKSDSTYDYLKPWHYVTIPDGQTYATASKAPEGDVISGIRYFTGRLKSDTLTLAEKQFALKALVHLVGDIHQPLHVGNGQDRGGNDVKVKYFWQNSNLHRVWDSGMIDSQKLSYTEWARKLDHTDKALLEKWQASDVEDWAAESMALRSSVYDLPASGNLSYRYNYDHLHQVELRLHQAGIRLAGLLNEIFG